MNSISFPQLVQNLYTLHLFVILFYSILPDTMQNVHAERFLYRELGGIDWSTGHSL